MDSAPKEKHPVGENIHVMPDEFYGGTDPVVHYKKQSIVIEDTPQSMPAAPKPPSLPPPPLSSAAPMTNAPQARSFWQKRKALLLSGMLVVGLTAGTSAYYFWQAGYIGRSEPAAIPAPPTFPPVVFAPTTTESVPETPGATLETPTTTVDVRNLPLDFPPIIFTDFADLDADSLTDMEEELFAVDSGAYDTDLDGYYDGQEIFNLYNPKGTAPMKIIDSGLVLEYGNPTYQYRLYYPAPWNAASVDPASEQVLFSSITGDYVEVRAAPRFFGETFPEWFGRMAGGQLFTELTSSTNRFQVDMWQRNDGAVFYVPAEEYVFVILYHPLTPSAVPFRHVARMMAQSFRPTKTLLDIPPQATIPSAPTGTEEIIPEDVSLDETL